MNFDSNFLSKRSYLRGKIAMLRNLQHYAKSFKLMILMALTMTFISSYAENKLVYCVCNPRSKLIELLRCVGSGSDFKVMHIPGNWAYCHKHNFTDITKGWYREGAPTTYQQTKEDIYKELAKQSVFVGENTHTAADFFQENPDFLKDPRLQLVFLISNLPGAIISYYRKKQEYFDKLPKSQMTDSIGLKGMYELLKQITSNGGKAPHFIRSEDLYIKPSKTVESLCKFLGVPFRENSLHWLDQSAQFTNFAQWGWYTIELTDCSKTWHMEAIKSTGFTKPETFAVDVKGNPTFEEIANPKHRDICMRAYRDNLPYYELLFGKRMSKL